MTSPHSLSFLEEVQTDVCGDVQQPVDNDNPSTNHHPFSWLNNWIIYFPMCTKSTINNGKTLQRKEILSNTLCICITVILLCCWCWDVIIEFVDYGFTMFTLIWSLSISLLNISRLLSVYYFFYHFKFYGVDQNDNNYNDIQRNQMDASTLKLTEHHKLTKEFSIRMKTILYLAILFLIIINISIAIQQATDPQNNESNTALILKSAYGFISIYLYDIPLFLVQFILSIYYCRGCIFISSLNEIIDKSINIDFEEAIKEYVAFRNAFEKQIHLLEKIIMLRIIALVAFVWIDITEIIESSSWIQAMDNCLWFAIMILPMIELVLSGNAATVNFHEFRRKLYSVGTGVKHITFFSEESINHSEYLFLMEYVTEYPFLIKIFAKEVSVKNALRIVAVFIVAKVVAYLFKTKLVSV